MELKQQVERLAKEGSDLAAYTCYGIEVCHSPYVMATGTDSDLFFPLPKMPCCVENCQRCAAHFGGFKFPWLGLWNSRGVVLPPDVAPNEASNYCPTPTLRQQPAWCHRSSTPCSSGAQRVTLGSWAWVNSSTNGEPGWLASAAKGYWPILWSGDLTRWF